MKKYSDKMLEEYSKCIVSIRLEDEEGDGRKEINIPINEFQSLLTQLAVYEHEKTKKGL